MKSTRSILAMLVLGLLVQPAMAFQQTEGGTAEPAPSTGMAGQSSNPAVEHGKGLNLSAPTVTLGKGSGTEVRIPGIGTVGVLPKLDFGLELLYGANDSKGLPEEQLDSNDVQIRGTIKHRF